MVSALLRRDLTATKSTMDEKLTVSLKTSLLRGALKYPSPGMMN